MGESRDLLLGTTEYRMSYVGDPSATLGMTGCLEMTGLQMTGANKVSKLFTPPELCIILEGYDHEKYPCNAVKSFKNVQ